MNRYELTYIIDTAVEENARKELIEKFSELIKANGGEIEKVDETWGKRRLAYAINDKTGRSFPILREEHCRSTLYNAEKLWLADKMDELQELGLRWLRLNFTTENSKEIENVIKAYQNGEGGMPDRATRGLYYRGVQ